MITSFLSNEIVYALSWTLIHSLWQVTLVAVLLMLLLKVIPALNSTHRYMVALSSLVVILLMSLVTFTSYYFEGTETGLIGSFMVPLSVEPQGMAQSTEAGIVDYLEYYTPLIVNLWIIGALVFFLKIAGGFFYMRNLVRQSQPAENKFNKKISKLKKAFNITRSVELKESIRVTTPLVMGYIKPVILFPVGLINQLSISEVECILAHEMAHIKRHDFILNIFQMTVESIFYFHPAIWYISSRISAERENCCDDIAINYTNSSISYAKTLVKLQDLRLQGNFKPALAYSGNKKAFTNRIMRILNQTNSHNQYRDKILVLFLVFTSLILGANNWESDTTVESESPELYFIDDCLQKEEDIKFYLDTIPEKNSFHVKKVTDETDVEMEMKDGKIVKLRINGEDIPEEDFEDHKYVIKELSPSEHKKIVTVLPECDGDIGNVYFIDKSKSRIVKIDSILAEEEIDRVNEIRKFWTSDMAYKELHEAIIDTIEPGVIRRRYPERKIEKKIYLDSVLDLMPDKMPDIAFFSEDLEKSKGLTVELERALEGLHKNDEREKIIIELKKEMDEKGLKEKIRMAQPELEKSIEIEVHRDRLRRMEERERERRMDVEKRLRFHSKDGNNFEFREKPHHISFIEKRTETVADVLARQLLEDQLIDADETSEIEITGKFLKINGDKQPKNIWNKYRKIYEKQSGIEMNKGSKLKFEIDPSEYNTANKLFFGTGI